ncbi:unnamed protein product [Candida verbasci]|uniref:HRDC domain-containing protein n=1 Tax=Candida verbasci TaxID=1227364 RepID=A0A9W4TY86_9ASCO|nr:unnamed protein product [Candida verbasci]
MPGDKQQQDDIFKDILPYLTNTIRSSTGLAAQDINFYKSIDSNLNEDITNQSKRLLNISNNLIKCCNNSYNLEYGVENVIDKSWNGISHIFDSIFEKLDYEFDQLNNKNQKGKELQYLDDGKKEIYSGKVQDKPQLHFKTPIDNSESTPFKPKLKIKPNSLKPLNENLINPAPVYEDSIEIIDSSYYEQPYSYEIENQPYPSSILEKSEPIPPKNWNETDAIWVDTVEELNKMIESLESSTEIAVDLEHHDYRSYYGLVCLMQISNRQQDWIIDTLKLRDELVVLNEIFTNPQIIKVFHGAFMDIIWLQRDLGLYIVSLFDTYHASRQLGFPKHSLAYLLEAFANFKTSKKYQLADWRMRPLSTPMKSYARSDTHFLLYIFDQLKNQLIEQDKLSQVLYDSRMVAIRRFEYTKYRPLINGNNVSCPIMAQNPKEPYNNIIIQYNVPRFKKHIVEILYNWRDIIAKEADESVRYIMPNQLLVSIANLNAPVDTNKILNCSTYVSEYVRLNAKELAELVNRAIKDIETNDWEMVDSWNKPIEETRTVDVKDIENVFNLLKEKEEIFEATLLKESSRVFNVHDNLLSLEITENGSKKNDLSQKVIDYSLLEEKPVQLHIEEIPEEIEEEVIEEQPQPELKGKDTLFTKTHTDELITLKKKNAKQVQHHKKQDNTARIDFANADKILITDNKKKFDKNRKRKSFDPYGKDGDGPKPVKRAKPNTQGKTSVYRSKK